MNRYDVIQAIINQIKAKTYLEIGVARGRHFLRMKVPTKIGIDPEFRISKKEKYESSFKNISNIFNKYYEMTSDSFFSKYKNILEKTHLDVVFVDGWHGYEQSLRDV